MSLNIAVVGATGNIGQEILNLCDERELAVETMHAVASNASIGREVSFGEEKTLKVQGITTFDFSKCDLAFFAAGPLVAEEFAEKAAEAGCTVIDTSEAFRAHEDIPMVAADVNPEALENFREKNIIATPASATVQLAAVLKPLQALAPIRRVVVSTYQSVAAAGRPAMDELFNQTRSIYMNQPFKPQAFSKQIAFNAIPQVGEFLEDGRTTAEENLIAAIQRLVSSEILGTASCVHIPVFVADAQTVSVEFSGAVDEEAARAALRETEGLAVIDYRLDEGYVTPEEAAGDELVFISRLRQDDSVPYGLNFWSVMDSVRKGVALNAVQTAEVLIDQYLS